MSGVIWHLWDDHYSRHEPEAASNAEFTPKIDTIEDMEALASQAPRLPHDKAMALLRNAAQRTKVFGEEITYKVDDLAKCYAASITELSEFSTYLEELGYLDHRSTKSGEHLKLKAGAFNEFLQSQSLTVFISSTVYDLLDLRAELAEHLESAGHVVRMSEDYERFDVDQKSDSIQQCLNNLKASEVIICLLDQRFGGVIQEHANEQWNGKSATQVEYEYARKLDLPVYAFIRDKAELDAGLIRGGGGTRTRWVEARGRDESKAKWLEFYDSLVKLKGNPQEPNWYDPFRTSVDLKKLVDKRLNDYVKSR
ncbi:DUF4062 domain-containing protein [Thalassoglobus polymorphus]|uniref:DUF4062 domain-containing protein n=1 Tax=Thalassoglobus polymorphus TaxID=2527994 RepID=UPI0018D244C6|nr:DUF4062 domain-containing protein [Thalassoglobus polymorphus]